MDIGSRFSAGTLRVIEAALGMASDPQALTGEHLLWALWNDESRAADLLARAGATEAILTAALGEQVSGTPAESIGASTLPRTFLFRSIADEAHRQAVQEQTGSEILTEHLLRAVILAEEALTQRLAEHGVRVAELDKPFSPQEDRTAEKLPTEIRLRNYEPAITESVVRQRLLDASFNRCREGLRVLEDYVRFTRDDPALTRLLKEIRHELAVLGRRLGVDAALAVRDTENDVGTTIHTAAEGRRESVIDVLRANCRRVEESLRTLEEFGKLIDSQSAGRIGQLRYQVYTLERAILAGEERHGRIEACQLYLLASEHLCQGGLGDVIQGAIAGGVDVVQLREKGISDRRLLSLARYVRDWTAEAGVLFIVNDRPDLAALVHADGLHLGQDDLSVDEARRIVGGKMLIGVSTHNIEQARQAVLEGADYLGVGPCFPSTTKSFQDFAGLEYVREAAAEIRIPWFAIGGINPETLPKLTAAGARRIAVSATICGAESPADAAAALKTMLPTNPAGEES